VLASSVNGRKSLTNIKGLKIKTWL
jgi:hypothetical protein